MTRGRFRWIRECDYQGREDPEEAVVWVDIRRFNLVWLQHDPARHFSPEEAAKQPRYIKFGKWLAEASEPIIMPRVGAFHGWAFSDGRHRFCWFRDNGFGSLPVTVWCNDADELQRIAGA